jgi:hypothetical protein
MAMLPPFNGKRDSSLNTPRVSAPTNLNGMASSGLDRATLANLDESIEVDMVTPRRDGSLSRRPIWVVVVNGNAYVRSYRGESGGWYRRARADGLATIGVDGRALEVRVQPVCDDETNRKVSDAFHAKYTGSARPDRRKRW